jgi:hypothetical protein
MVIHLLVALLISPVGLLLYQVYCLALNYRIARRVGVPLVVLPFSLDNVLWILVGKYFIPLFERLPFGNGNFTRFSRHGWSVKDDGKAHLEFGDIFIIVTPKRNWMFVCNAEVVADILRRGSDFPRPLETLG